LLSGFLYPFANMPIPAQILGNLFPLTHYIAAARSAILRGGDALAVASLAWPIGLQAILFALAAWVIVRRRL
jgi:ABC-2 type transport system permease protein